jgi:hypothetical protein
LVETRRAMNISSPGEFMQAVPGVTDELHVALTSANTELVGAGSRAMPHCWRRNLRRTNPAELASGSCDLGPVIRG